MFLFESGILFAGCYYLSDHYDNGERIDTNEPCLNCTCLNSMLMCYLRICPFVKPVGEECIVEREEGDCCPKIWCPEVIKTKDNSPNTNEKRKQQQQPGCYLGDQYYADGAQLPHDPKRPCEVCYCIRNSTACVMQECELKVDGCFPIYKEGQCCPCRYNCTYEEATPTPPGVTLTELAEGCTLPDGSFVEDGEAVNSTNPCEHCYCMRNEVVCAIQECQAPGDNCRPVPPKPDQCCPDRYECLVNSISPNGFEKPVSLTFSTLFTTSPGPTASVDISGNIKGKINEGTRIKGAPKKEIVDEIPSPVYIPPTPTKTTESTTEESNAKTSAESSSPVYIFADQTTPSEFSEEVLSTELSTEIHSTLHIPTDQSKLSESSAKESSTEIPNDTLSPINLSFDQSKTNEASIEESSSSLPTVTQKSPITSVPYSQESSISDAFSTTVPSHDLTDEDKLVFGGDAENLSSEEYSTSISERISTLSTKTSTSSYSSDITSPHTELTTISSEKSPISDAKTTLSSHSDDISSDVSTHQSEFSTATPVKVPILDAEATLSSISNNIPADVTIPQFDPSNPTEIKFKETGSSKTDYGVDEPSFGIVSSTSPSTTVSQEVNAENYSTQSSSGPLHDETIHFEESSSETPKENDANIEKVSHAPPKFVRIKGRKPTVQTTTEVSVQMSSTESLTVPEFALNETSFNDTKVIEETGMKNAQKKDPYQHTKGKRPQIKQKPLLPVGVIPGESKLSGNFPISSSTKGRPILVNVPGEGNCHLGKTAYKHGQEVPSTDVCKVSCQCSRGKIYCVEIKCEILHPENFANCQIVQNKSECCPHYECGSEVTKSIETIEVTVVDESTIAPNKEINVPKATDTSTVTSKVTDGTTVTDNSLKAHTTTEANDSDYTEEKYSTSTTQVPFSIYVTQLGQTTTAYETSTSSGDTEFSTEEKNSDPIHKIEPSTEISHSPEAFETTTVGETTPSDIDETSHGVTSGTEISYTTLEEKYQSTLSSVTSVIPDKDASQTISTEAPIKISISDTSETYLTDGTFSDIDDTSTLSTKEADKFLTNSSTTIDINENPHTTSDDLEVKKITETSTIVEVSSSSPITTERLSEDLTTHVSFDGEEIKSPSVSEQTTVSGQTVTETSDDLTGMTTDKSVSEEEVSSEAGINEKIYTIHTNVETGSGHEETHGESSFISTKAPVTFSRTTEQAEEFKTPETTITPFHESTVLSTFGETTEKASTDFHSDTSLSDEFSFQTTFQGVSSTQLPKVDLKSTTKYQPDVVKTTVVEGQDVKETSFSTDIEEYFTENKNSGSVTQTTLISKVSTTVQENGTTPSSDSANAFITSDTSSPPTVFPTTLINKNTVDETKAESSVESDASKSTYSEETTEKTPSNLGETTSTKYEVTEISSSSPTAVPQTDKGQYSTVVVTADVFIESSQPDSTEKPVTILPLTQTSLLETTSEQGADTESAILHQTELFSSTPNVPEHSETGYSFPATTKTPTATEKIDTSATEHSSKGPDTTTETTSLSTDISSIQTSYDTKDLLNEHSVGISVTEQGSTSSEEGTFASEEAIPPSEATVSALDEEKLISIEEKTKPTDKTTETDGYIETHDESTPELQESHEGNLEDQDIYSKKKEQTSDSPVEVTKSEEQTKPHTKITDSSKGASEFQKEVTESTYLATELNKQTSSEGTPDSVEEIQANHEYQSTDLLPFHQTTTTDKPEDKDSGQENQDHDHQKEISGIRDPYTISTTQQTTSEPEKPTEKFSEPDDFPEGAVHTVADENKLETAYPPYPVTSSAKEQVTFTSPTEYSSSVINTIATTILEVTTQSAEISDSNVIPSSNFSNEIPDKVANEQYESTSTLRPQTMDSILPHADEDKEVHPIETASPETMTESDNSDIDVHTSGLYDTTSSIDTSPEDIKATQFPEAKLTTTIPSKVKTTITDEISSSVTQDESYFSSEIPFDLKETSSKQPASEYPSTSESSTDASIGHEKINYPDETSLDVSETSHHLEKNTSFIQGSKHQGPENVISTTSSTFITTIDKSIQVSEETKASATGYDTTEISSLDQKSSTTDSERLTTATPIAVSQDSTLSSVSEEFKHDGAVPVSEESLLEHSDDEEGIIEAFTYPPKQTEKPESHIKFEEPHKIPTEEEIAAEIDLKTTVSQKHSTEIFESSTTKKPHDEEFYSTVAESKIPEYSSETDKSESDFTSVSNENAFSTTYYSGTSTQPPKLEFVTHVSEIQDTFETSEDKKPEQVTSVKAEVPKVEQGELELTSPSAEKEQSTIVTDVPQTISFGESHSQTSSSIETSKYLPQSSTEFIEHKISTSTTSSPVKESWISTLSDEKDNLDITTNNNNEIGDVSEFNKTTTSSFRPENTEHITILAEEDPYKTEFTSDEATVPSEITKQDDLETAGSNEKTSEGYILGDSSSVLPENKVTVVKATTQFVTINEDKYTKIDETTKEHDVSPTLNPIDAETEKAHEFSTQPSRSRPEIITNVPTSSTDFEYDDTFIENVNKHSTSFIEQSEETDESFGGSTAHSLSSKVTSEVEPKQTTSISPALLDNEESKSTIKEDPNLKFTTVQDIIYTTDAFNKEEFSESSKIVSNPTEKYDVSYITDEYSDGIATESAHVKYSTLPPSSTMSETEERLAAKTTTEKYEVHVSTISEDSDSGTTTSSPIDFNVTTSVGKEIKTTLTELNSDIKANDMISDSDKTLSTSTVSPKITQNLQQKTETSIYHLDSESFTENQSSDHITTVTDTTILIKDQETFSDIQDHTSGSDIKVTSQPTILTDSEATKTIAPSEIEKVSDDVKYETTSTDSSENIRTQEYGFHKQTYPPEVTKKELADSSKDYDLTKFTSIVTTDKALSISESTTTAFTEHPLLLTEIQDGINAVSTNSHGLEETDANATEISMRPNRVSVTTSSPIFIAENLLDTTKISFEEESSSNKDVYETKSSEPDVITEIGSKFPTTLSISTNNNNTFDFTEQTFKNEMHDQTSTSLSFDDKEAVSVDSERPTTFHETITPQKTDTDTATIGSFNSAITQDYGFHKEVYSPPKHETTTQFVELFDTTKSLVSFETSVDDSLAQTIQEIGSDTSSDTSTSISEGTHYQSDEEYTTDLINTSTTHHITTLSKESTTDLISSSTTPYITTLSKEPTTHHITTPINELTSKLTDISTENPLASISHSKHASSTFSTSNTAIDQTTAPVAVNISDIDENEITGKGRPHAETTISSVDISTSASLVDVFTKGHTKTETAHEEKVTEDHDYENNSNILFHSTMSEETSETDKFASELNTKKLVEQDYLYTTYITHSPSAENDFKDFTVTSHTKLDENYSESSLTEHSPLATLDEDKDTFETISDRNVSVTNLEDVTIPTKSSSEYEYLLTTNETNIDVFSDGTISELSKTSTKKPLEISVIGSHTEETFVTDIESAEKNIYNDTVKSTFSPDQPQYISSHTESTTGNTKLPQEISHVDLSTVPDLHTEFSFKDDVSDYRGTTISDDSGLSTVPQLLVTEQIEQLFSFPHQSNESHNVLTEAIDKVTESSELKNDTETSFDFSSVTPSIILDVSKTSSVNSAPDIISSASLPSIDSDAPQSTNYEVTQSEGTEKILDLDAFTITEGSVHSSTLKSISSTMKETDSWQISEEDKSVTLKPFTHDNNLGITEKQNNLENETTYSSALPSTFSEDSAHFTTIYPPTDISTAISDGITISAQEKDSSLSHKDMLETIASYFPHSSPPSILSEIHKPSSTTTSVPVHKHTTAKPEVETQHNFPEDGYCLYENQVYNSAEQIPRKDPCEFCFCFRGDIICLQQSCPPPIRGCYATPIDGFCCPRFHCPVQEMHFNLSTTTTTTADPRMGKYLPPSDQNTGCEIEGNVYRVHQVVRPSSGPCMLCRCELGGIMKCDPRDCQPQAPLLLRLNKDFFRKR
ncbi:uncharacterized protein TNCT_389951 [Trichonephila clavata]|uniref:VWFC domain-containing protein n=1 Tax=Trichonephila clavata TaxID=2740835 RepID=A0A8X6I904_TRICU|nr:uncharacterized protein TNCT_389951 [Trichonephila clavata]